MSAYAEFLVQKAITAPRCGLETVPALTPALYPFQADIVSWALKRGRAAIFADCGMGKTPMQLEWARHLSGDVLILAPLAVAKQTVHEGEKFGIPVRYCRSEADRQPGITITNYEMLEHFTPEAFTGVVLDESSILKAYDGKTRTRIIEAFREVPYRLACTATPAPNDYMELGNHAEFLGVMTRAEMLAMFFVHDGGETQTWRLKGHAQQDFWRWLASWAVMIRKPSDLGYEDGAFILPPLQMHEHVLRVDRPTDGYLFALEAVTLQDRIAARRESINERVAEAVRIIRQSWHTTQNTRAFGEQSIEIQSVDAVQSGTRRTKKKSKRASSDGETITATKNSRGIRPTAPPTDSGYVRTCANATNANEATSLPTTKPAELVRLEGESSVIGGCVGTSESASSITKDCLVSRAADARSAPPRCARTVEDSLSTIAMRQESSVAFSVTPATVGSGNCETTPHYFVEQQRTSKMQWVVWCNLNSEQEAIAAMLGKDCVSIYGSLSVDEKIDRYERFARGEIAVLVTKSSIFGFGINMQFCSHSVFLGISDSWESFYQATRRTWRFGQCSPVDVHIVIAATEGAVLKNIKDKEVAAAEMSENIVVHMREQMRANLKGTTRMMTTYECERAEGENWTLHLADCVEVVRDLEADSIHYSIFSPPFASLYTYSASDRDMGNCKNTGDFLEHFGFLVAELYRVLMAGRLVSIHCMNLPTSKVNHGYIGIRDFRGDIIRLFESHGFIFHSEVCIWKDPVTAMQRTKALGLLYKQLKKDSAMSRQGIPDYLVTMRKPGENPERVTKQPESFPVDLWQRYASPVWHDINPSDTLQFRSAREQADERHICPLQLQVIERGIELWTNPGDLVLSPFAGIGSEGYVALQLGRRFIGAELKRSYWEQACANLRHARASMGQLFAT